MELKSEIDILLVEDNEGDIRLAKEALVGSKVNNRLFVVRNGEDALNYLFRRNGYENSVRPDLIILDLNLPGIHGSEILKKIKSDTSLSKIPVVILTTSDDKNDIIETYSLHANSFITKPIGWEEFIKVIRSIEDFWLSIVKLPRKDGK